MKAAFPESSRKCQLEADRVAVSQKMSRRNVSDEICSISFRIKYLAKELFWHRFGSYIENPIRKVAKGFGSEHLFRNCFYLTATLKFEVFLKTLFWKHFPFPEEERRRAIRWIWWTSRVTT